jgi:farnesyl-diphosphate farnesyltransferase
MDTQPARASIRTVLDEGPDLQSLLQKTSRTFALSIPLLAEPCRREIGVAYLLFRIIDTFEDATRWSPARRAEELLEFAALMETGQTPGDLAASWLREPPLDHPGYLELLAVAPAVLDWYQHLRPRARDLIGMHVARSARAMAEVVGRSDDQGALSLQSIDELRDYCYAVAGIVGEMLTELFILQSPALLAVAGELRARAVEFGEGLQLVNILKDASPDAAEGRVYLPAGATLSEVFALARSDLRRAVEYTELLRSGGADRGLVAFNALNASLAVGTIRLLRERGLGAKLTRPQVLGLTTQIMHALDSGGPLFPARP